MLMHVLGVTPCHRRENFVTFALLTNFVWHLQCFLIPAGPLGRRVETWLWTFNDFRACFGPKILVRSTKGSAVP